jgi:mRNA interferase MazF
VEIRDQPTRVLVEQTTAVDPERLGQLVGHLTGREIAAVDEALVVVLGLNPRSR